MAMKHLGVNLSTFSELIEKNCVYVDKTEIIYGLVSGVKKNYFLSRPRRFGKSLLVSTFNALFSGRKDLFKECWIGSSDYNWQHYPVIALDFSGISQRTPELFEQSLQGRLTDIAKSHDIEIAHTFTPSGILTKLVTHLAQTSKVVILIDEYDSPLLTHIHTIDKALEMQSIVRDFFKTIKALDQHLRFVFLTGVSKFAQTSVFSGLNNLQDLTFAPEGAALLGYTEQEITHYFSEHLHALVPKKELPQLMNALRTWYNGYQFSSEKTSIFAPYSVLLFLDGRGIFKNYWFNTATPSFLINLLKAGNYSLKDLNKPIISEEELGSFELENLPLTTLLFQTGYLTIKKYNLATHACSLDYPNHEVRQSFLQSIAKLCTNFKQAEVTSYASQLRDHLEKRNIDSFLKVLQNYFKEIPYTLAVKDERNVQLIVYSVCLLIGAPVEAEIATSLGRIDITLTTPKDIYLIELKYGSTGKKAMEQIEDREYFSHYLSSKKEITLVGVAFDKRKKTLADNWVIKKYEK